jgi:hypothetical protein
MTAPSQKPWATLFGLYDAEIDRDGPSAEQQIRIKNTANPLFSIAELYLPFDLPYPPAEYGFFVPVYFAR